MARTILDIAKEAAERDATAPVPVSLFSNRNDRVARILRTAANDVLRDYLRRSRWAGLSEFHSTWVFALQPGRYAYELPPDLLKFIPNTEQREGWPMGLIGPATPQMWSWWLYGGQTNVAPHGWRIKNNVLWIDPTPTTEELVTIEYVSRYPVVSTIRAGDFDLSSSPLQTVAPIVPRDGWLKLPDTALVQDRSPAAGRYDEGGLGYDLSEWPLEPEEVLKRLVPSTRQGPLPQVRREAFCADTDTPVFSDDYLLSLGMTWHLQRALGLPYAERASEYEDELQMKLAEDGGGARDFRLGGGECDFGTYPLGPGQWLVS
ncbi:phage adaptor protein [Salipiger marinus]|uniref:Uncharacterized protein n=1 Tax=Salipiger marinus TaxID=555512 RepID=A0A1G8MRB9_9RHOB|nr:hypothetical protein [Salipiger marinus]SDI70464.1 hypothetical protein SAMN04487993_1008220 [Salipiger marinus]